MIQQELPQIRFDRVSVFDSCVRFGCGGFRFQPPIYILHRKPFATLPQYTEQYRNPLPLSTLRSLVPCCETRRPTTKSPEIKLRVVGTLRIHTVSFRLIYNAPSYKSTTSESFHFDTMRVNSEWWASLEKVRAG